MVKFKVNKKILLLVILILGLIAVFFVYSSEAISFTKEQYFTSNDLIDKTFIYEDRALRFIDNTEGQAILSINNGEVFTFTYEVNKSDLNITYENGSKAEFLICSNDKLWSIRNRYFLYLL